MRANRIIAAGMGIVVLLVVGILGFGWWREYVARASDPVATVAGSSISIDHYARMLDFRRKATEQQLASMQIQLQTPGNEALADLFTQQIQQLQFSLLLLPDQTLDQLIDEQLIRQEAARRGMTVTSQEIDDEIEKSFGDPPAAETGPASAAPAGEATPAATPGSSADQATPALTSAASGAQPTAGAAAEPTPAASPSPAPTADVKARVHSYLAAYGLTESEFRNLVETQLLYQKLEDAMGTEVATSAEQLHARHILVETEEKAKEIAEKLKNGASFEEVAKAESTDTATKENGGDLGWFPRGQMVADFEQAVFGLPVKQISDPVNTSFGWHIIEVLEKEENRPLDEQALAQRKSQALPEWLSQAGTGAEIKRNLTDDDKNWVFKRIKWSPPA
ncbi:MAG: peptidylprolyl isomerase [Chloroflexota bacterium]